MQLKKLDMVKIFCLNKCFKHYQVSKKYYVMGMIESLEGVHYGLHTGTGWEFLDQNFSLSLRSIYGHFKKTGYGRILSFHDIIGQI